MGLMELSHRSKAFDAVITGAEAKLRSLMKIPDNYKVATTPTFPPVLYSSCRLTKNFHRLNCLVL